MAIHTNHRCWVASAAKRIHNKWSRRRAVWVLINDISKKKFKPILFKFDFDGEFYLFVILFSSFQMLILLYSDTNYVLNGFQAEYFISNW